MLEDLSLFFSFDIIGGDQAIKKELKIRRNLK